jgi:hypothetical protein
MAATIIMVWVGAVKGNEPEGQSHMKSTEIEKQQIWMSAEVPRDVSSGSDVLKVKVVNKRGSLVTGIVRSYRYRAPITIRIVDESKEEAKKTKEGAIMFGLTPEEEKEVDQKWLPDVWMAKRGSPRRDIGFRQEYSWHYHLLKLFALKPGTYFVSAGLSFVLPDGEEAEVVTEQLSITVVEQHPTE